MRVLVELVHPQSPEKDAQTIRDHMPRQNVVAVQGDAVSQKLLLVRRELFEIRDLLSSTY